MQIYLICKIGLNDKPKIKGIVRSVLKGRGQHGIQDKTKALDTQANLAESDKGSFYNQGEWSKFYYGEFINYY